MLLITNIMPNITIHIFFFSDLHKRHYYEVIPQGAPCKLFFDLEFSIELNPSVDGDHMCIDFKAALTRHLTQVGSLAYYVLLLYSFITPA